MLLSPYVYLSLTLQQNSVIAPISSLDGLERFLLDRFSVEPFDFNDRIIQILVTCHQLKVVRISNSVAKAFLENGRK